VPPLTPEDGETVSHPEPVTPARVAVQLRTPPAAFWICTVLVCGADPAGAVNSKGLEADTESDGKYPALQSFRVEQSDGGVRATKRGTGSEVDAVNTVEIGPKET